MPQSSNVITIIALGFTGLGFLFAIVSQATNFWIEQDFLTSGKEHWGLWKTCTELNDQSSCSKIEFIISGEFPDKFRTTRAFTILAIMAYALAGFFLILSAIKKVPVFLFLIVIAAAGLFQLIGMAVFTDLYRELVEKSDHSEYGWSYDLGWGTFAFALISFGMGVALKISSSREETV